MGKSEAEEVVLLVDDSIHFSIFLRSSEPSLLFPKATSTCPAACNKVLKTGRKVLEESEAVELDAAFDFKLSYTDQIRLDQIEEN